MNPKQHKMDTQASFWESMKNKYEQRNETLRQRLEDLKVNMDKIKNDECDSVPQKLQNDNKSGLVQSLMNNAKSFILASCICSEPTPSIPVKTDVDNEEGFLCACDVSDGDVSQLETCKCNKVISGICGDPSCTNPDCDYQDSPCGDPDCDNPDCANKNSPKELCGDPDCDNPDCEGTSASPANLTSASLFSLGATDVFYMQQIANLVNTEKEIRVQIEQLEDQEKSYKAAMEIKARCLCQETYDRDEVEHMTTKIKEENTILKKDLEDMKLELRHCFERIEGPMKHTLENERSRCTKLEKQIECLNINIGGREDTFMKELSGVKAKLCNACCTMVDLTNANTKLKQDLDNLDKKYVDLEEELLKQKLKEAETILKFKTALSRRCPGLDESRNRGDDSDQDLDTIARKLSKSLKSVIPCALPSDVTDTVQNIKELTEFVSSKQSPEEKKFKKGSIQKSATCSCLMNPIKSENKKEKKHDKDNKHDEKKHDKDKKHDKERKHHKREKQCSAIPTKSVSKHSVACECSKSSKNKLECGCETMGDCEVVARIDNCTCPEIESPQVLFDIDKTKEPSDVKPMSDRGTQINIAGSIDKIHSEKPVLSSQVQLEINKTKPSDVIPEDCTCKQIGDHGIQTNIAGSTDTIRSEEPIMSTRKQFDINKTNEPSDVKPENCSCKSIGDRGTETKIAGSIDTIRSEKATETNKSDTKRTKFSDVKQEDNTSKPIGGRGTQTKIVESIDTIRSAKATVTNKSAAKPTKTSIVGPSEECIAVETFGSSSRTSWRASKTQSSETRNKTLEPVKSPSERQNPNYIAGEPFDVHTTVDIVEQPTHGVHVVTTVTPSGTIEIVTEGAPGMLETKLTYLDDGRIEIFTQLTDRTDTANMQTMIDTSTTDGNNCSAYKICQAQYASNDRGKGSICSLSNKSNVLSPGAKDDTVIISENCMIAYYTEPCNLVEGSGQQTQINEISCYRTTGIDSQAIQQLDEGDCSNFDNGDYDDIYETGQSSNGQYIDLDPNAQYPISLKNLIPDMNCDNVLCSIRSSYQLDTYKGTVDINYAKSKFLLEDIDKYVEEIENDENEILECSENAFASEVSSAADLESLLEVEGKELTTSENGYKLCQNDEPKLLLESTKEKYSSGDYLETFTHDQTNLDEENMISTYENTTTKRLETIGDMQKEDSLQLDDPKTEEILIPSDVCDHMKPLLTTTVVFDETAQHDSNYSFRSKTEGAFVESTYDITCQTKIVDDDKILKNMTGERSTSLNSNSENCENDGIDNGKSADEVRITDILETKQSTSDILSTSTVSELDRRASDLDHFVNSNEQDSFENRVDQHSDINGDLYNEDLQYSEIDIEKSGDHTLTIVKSTYKLENGSSRMTKSEIEINVEKVTARACRSEVEPIDRVSINRDRWAIVVEPLDKGDCNIERTKNKFKSSADLTKFSNLPDKTRKIQQDQIFNLVSTNSTLKFSHDKCFQDIQNPVLCLKEITPRANYQCYVCECAKTLEKKKEKAPNPPNNNNDNNLEQRIDRLLEKDPLHSLHGPKCECVDCLYHSTAGKSARTTTKNCKCKDATTLEHVDPSPRNCLCQPWSHGGKNNQKHGALCTCVDCICDPCHYKPKKTAGKFEEKCSCEVNASTSKRPPCDCPICICEPCLDPSKGIKDAKSCECDQDKPIPPCDCSKCICEPCSDPMKILKDDGSCLCAKPLEQPGLICDCPECTCDPCLDPNKLRKVAKKCTCKKSAVKNTPCDCIKCACEPCSDSNKLHEEAKSCNCEPEEYSKESKNTSKCDCKMCECAPCFDSSKNVDDVCFIDNCTELSKQKGDNSCIENNCPNIEERSKQPSQNQPTCDCKSCDCKSCADPSRQEPKQLPCDCPTCNCPSCPDPTRKKSSAVCDCPVCECIAACDCAACVCKTCPDPKKIKTTSIHDSFECKCDLSGATTKTSNTCQCYTCLCKDCPYDNKSGSKPLIDEEACTCTPERAKEIEEITSALKDIQCTCDEAENIGTKPFMKKASDFETTVSKMQLKLGNLQKKCLEKDKIINAMTTDLQERCQSGIFANLLRNMACPRVDNAPDYTRAYICDYLPRPRSNGKGRKPNRKSVCPFERNLEPILELDRYDGMEECNCPRNVDLTGMEIVDIRRVTIDSFLIKWQPPCNLNNVTGYQIYVNDVLKYRVLSPTRTNAVLDTLDLRCSLEITLFAVALTGLCEPPALATYKM